MTNEENCSQYYHDTLRVSPLPEPSLMAEDTLICAGEEQVFSTQYHEDHDYDWSATNGGEIVYEEGGEAAATWSEEETAAIQVTETTFEEEGSCRAEAIQEVIIEPAPEPALSGPDAICQNDREAQYIFDYNEELEYEKQVEGGEVTKETQNSFMIHWQEEGSLTFSAMDPGTQNQCRDEETIDVAIRDLPNSEIRSSSKGILKLEATAEDMASYTWNSGDGTTLEGQEVAHDYEEAGIYEPSLIVEDEAGCRDTITEEVSYMPTPIDGDCGLELTVYPNPFEDSFEVLFTLEEEQEIEGYLYDVKGQPIVTFIEPVTLEEGEHLKTFEEPGEGLNRGLYFGRIYLNNESCVFRVVRE